MAKTFSSYTALFIHSTGCPKNHGKENNVVKSFYRVYQESWPKKLPCYIILQGVPLNMMVEKRLAKIVFDLWNLPYDKNCKIWRRWWFWVYMINRNLKKQIFISRKKGKHIFEKYHGLEVFHDCCFIVKKRQNKIHSDVAKVSTLILYYKIVR